MVTRLSSKGQVVLPQAVREAHRWKTGTEFIVEDTGDSVLLRPVSPFPATRIEDVFGSAGYNGPTRSIADMDEAVRNEAKRRAQAG